MNNLLRWTGCSITDAIKAVTITPAKMLGISEIKGSLTPGADADIVILEDIDAVDGVANLSIKEVWKFGVQVYSASK